ncbi:LEM domain-containing protein 2-like isoform X2 [Rhopalosiphum maidis]|uniref:LEM domain-containing protein 2-like isoform X2 n=1 Tax=Rhopalosiphum maidis TaxID=43146 RepID=UPI000EFDE552|nr:LEM domain-containing protein 2-like isoform X2 [Rhopalosiphum maidis]
MGEIISDQELRRRLLAFNAVVPPVTSTTRNLLLKKLASLEGKQSNKTAASNIMPPPKLRGLTSGTNESIIISSSVDGKHSQHKTFDSMNSPRKSVRQQRQYRAPDLFETSDSETDTGTLGHSILPANPYIASSSPKSNETSLMNVSNWKNSYDHQNAYVSTEGVNQQLRSSSVSKTSSHADQAIQRWKEKMMNQSRDKDNVSKTTSLFNSPSPISKISSKNLRKNFVQSTQQKNLINYTKNTQNIILLFVGFFAVIFGLYFISIQPNTTVLPSSILSSLCAKKSLQGVDCDTEQEKVQRLYNSLVSQVQDKYIKNQCDKSDIEPIVNPQTVFEYISTHEHLPSREIEELVELFKSIAKTYSDSPIGFDTSFNISVKPNLPIICAIKHIFSNMFYLITWLGIVALSIVGLYFVICYISAKSENYKQEVNQLVENTIDLLKEQAQNKPNESYLPIIHIRDHLIPFNERQAKSKIWAEVVQYFTESESSVRSEVQEIDGEDFQVWRWIQPMSPGV